MASRPWSSHELAVLELHAQPYDLASACRKLQDRTQLAVKVRLAKLRAEMGMGDGRRERGGGDEMEEFNATAAIATERLREATLRVGVWA